MNAVVGLRKVWPHFGLPEVVARRRGLPAERPEEILDDESNFAKAKYFAKLLHTDVCNE